jgi:hypothetical protein
MRGPLAWTAPLPTACAMLHRAELRWTRRSPSAATMPATWTCTCCAATGMRDALGGPSGDRPLVLEVLR